MSVGHIARTIEERGIPTVAVYIRAFAHIVEEMKLPRAVITNHAMGRPLGPPGDAQRQRQVVTAALRLIDTADSGGTVFELPGEYRPAQPDSHIE